MIRRFIAWVLGRRLIVLFDHDGEESLRLERISPSGRSWCKRFGWGIRNVYLRADGGVDNGCYVTRWAVIADYRRPPKRGVILSAKNCDVIVFPRTDGAA